MAIFKCKMCGGDLDVSEGMSVAECQYCGTKQTLPKLDDDKKTTLYDRASHFRRNNEFDKAMGIYEQILNEDNTDAEAYWSLVLCRYGIEYVEDPASRKRIPTVNRAQFTSVFDDENYKSALQYADGYQKSIYEEEAKAINEIQKGILAISQQEEAFDVFICYKETDANGRRTPDSVLANDLYYQLTQEGFKVFFARITLEDKLGTAYEPYIFAALNSAKVMVVLGTKPEYFNAVWVRNEWSRYLALIKSGARKILIPAYKDIDPYDLPDEFAHLQSQDMSKLGFMQDLIRGIKKIAGGDEPQTIVRETVIANGSSPTNTEALIERAFIFLEDGEWKTANEYSEKVLDADAGNVQAYLVKLMSELRIHKEEQIATKAIDLNENTTYKKALRFAEGDLRDKLESYCQSAKENLQKKTALQEQEYLERLSNQYLQMESEIKKKNKNFCIFKSYTIFSLGFVCSMITLMILRGYGDSEEVTALVFGIIASVLLCLFAFNLGKSVKDLRYQITNIKNELVTKGESIDETMDTKSKLFNKYDLIILLLPIALVCIGMLVAAIVIPIRGVESGLSWKIENACVTIGSLIGVVLSSIVILIKQPKMYANNKN